MSHAMFPTPNHPAYKQQGVSLVEMMVAMAIGLVLIATIGYAYLGARQGFQAQNALSRIQENARYAFEFIGFDVRMAGYTGSSFDGGTPANVVAAPTTWDPNLKDLYGLPLTGYDNEAGDTFPTGVSPINGDAVMAVRADNENEFSVTAHNEGTSDFTISCVANASGLPQQGEIFVAADYTHSAVFQVKTVSSATCSGNSMTINYGTGTVSPGNATAALGTFKGPVSARKLYRLKGATYFLANNPAGEPSLYRLALGHSGTAANATAEELVQGVENMQVAYGVDTDATADKVVNAYWTADEVTAGSGPGPSAGTLTMPAGTASDYWKRVLSVRITLTLVSGQNEKVAVSGDRLLRKEFTNTVAVRNRL